jgi:hypothetical protein
MAAFPLEALIRKLFLTVLGATAIGISLATASLAQSAAPAAGLHLSKGHFSPVPRLKRSKTGADQLKSDPRLEQMRDPCTIEG